MCILIVEHQFNCMHPWCSWEGMLPGRCSPGKSCHTFWNRNIVLLPIVLGKVRCVPKPTLCKLYGVKFWEGLTRNSSFFGVPSWLYTILHSVLWRVFQNLKRVRHLCMGRVRALIKSCWVGSRREHARDITITTIGIPGIWNSRNSGIPVSLHILYGWSS